MMWMRPIWNAETPVNIAARRTGGASSAISESAGGAASSKPETPKNRR